MHHRSPYTGKVTSGVMYADHGYWDVYRAWYPLMSLLFPERLAEILQAWVNAYKEGGWLPQFPCPGYRACMTGSLIDSVFGDAAAKGIRGFDLATAYEGLRKHATEPGNPDAGYGRRGIEDYLQYHYCPRTASSNRWRRQWMQPTVISASLKSQRPWATKLTTRFLCSVRKTGVIFDSHTGFLRGKKADGKWQEPFDPITWGDPYVEGSAWQHRWDVPHNFAAVMESLGGEKKTVTVLEQMLTMPPDFNVGAYGQEIHEMSEMAAVRFGQYAQSNQPVHHVLYLFALAGRTDRTRYWVQKVMRELYTPLVFPGDEDTGSMAAWFIFGSLGFYPVCPGKPEYTLGCSFFPRVTLRLQNGKTLVVENATTDRSNNSCSLSGKPLDTATLAHSVIQGGGVLRFT